MTSLDLLMPVAAGARHAERAADALESLAAYEPDLGTIVLVDDGDEARELVDACVPAALRAQAVAIRNPRRGRDEGLYGGTCAATLAGLALLHERGTAAMVLRVDSDALAIAPFAAKIAAVFEADPEVGVVGSYDEAPTGVARDFGAWEPALRRLTRPVALYRPPAARAPHVRIALAGRARAVRDQLRAALANGYRFGEHCLAAACILSRPLVERMAAAGYLADPLTWLGTWCGDDVMLGVQARAAGMSLRGMTGDGEPFGIAQRRLPGPPEWLVAQGYSLIHAVKDDVGIDEQAVRAWFRARRGH